MAKRLGWEAGNIGWWKRNSSQIPNSNVQNIAFLKNHCLEFGFLGFGI